MKMDGGMAMKLGGEVQLQINTCHITGHPPSLSVVGPRDPPGLRVCPTDICLFVDL